MGQGRPASERGQATVEWVGLVALVALAFVLLASIAGLALPGAALARTIGGKIICAIRLDGDCSLEPSRLVAAYGDPLAAVVAEQVQPIRYEAGMRALPIDFRKCREDACAEGSDRIRVASSEAGLPVTAFTHIIDCRRRPFAPFAADCSGAAAANLYVQYWFYYPGSATGEGSIAPGVVRAVSSAVGKPSYHPDDWESLQLRIEPDGEVYARASAHHGYGIGWLPIELAGFTVSGGSHAGTVRPADFERVTPADRITLIPLEPIARAHPGTEFAVTPPWLKRVWLDPEYEGTD